MRQREQISRLLIISCSRRKNPASKKLPAIERYDGPIFQVLRKFLREFPKDARTLAWIPTVKVCLTFYGGKSAGDPVFIWACPKLHYPYYQ